MSQSRIPQGRIRRGRTERGRYWQGLVEEWSRSGLSQAEFCRQRDIKVVNFRWWKSQLSTKTRTGRRSPGGSRKQSRVSRNSFVELKMLETTPRGGYEVVLSGGRVLRLPQNFNPDTLIHLIKIVETAC